MAKVKKSIVFNGKSHSNDILLLREIVDKNPFRHGEKWAAIAESITDILKLEKAATARTMRERGELLLKKFKIDECASMKKTGVDEKFEELQQLLTEVRELSDDVSVEKGQRKAEIAKSKNDIKAGVLIRERAMKRLKDADESSADSDSGDEEIKPKKKKMERKGDPLMELLQKKLEIEEKKEARKEKELEERRLERLQNMELIRQAMQRNRNWDP